MNKVLSNLIYGLIYLWSLWPLRIHYLFADILRFFLYRVFRYRLGVVYTNLSRSFPQMKYDEIKALAEDFYHDISDVLAETLWAVSASDRELREHTGFEGMDDLEKAYNSGRCTVTLLAHLHNWEIWGGIPDLKQYYGVDIPNNRFNFIYKRPENRIADMVMLRMRTCHQSVNFVETNTIARHILSDKSRRNIYFFACDQYPARNTHIDLTFLNQPTGIISGPGEIARKLHLGAGYWSVRREGRGKYIARYVPICEDASLYEPGYVSREYARMLEEDILKDKSRWLWSHKRWK